jgi:glycosyltransferase involved in cell wall biosynthesis
VARAQAPHVLAEHDVLIFPSEWEEPFARSVLEGMAAGLTVIGSTTGGTGEILVEGQTGLTFTAGDSQELARQIGRLAQDPALRRRLAANGRSIVTRRFTLQRMVDELEAALVAIAGQTAPAPAQP